MISNYKKQLNGKRRKKSYILDTDEKERRHRSKCFNEPLPDIFLVRALISHALDNFFSL